MIQRDIFVLSTGTPKQNYMDTSSEEMCSSSSDRLTSKHQHSSTSTSSYLTAQQIADQEEEWREARMQLTLWKHPLSTLRLFFRGFYSFLNQSIKYLLTHPALLRIIAPTSLLWIFLRFSPGFHSYYIKSIEFWVQYVIWWVGLGILSSIGLGSGLQTGVLFLFPHMLHICIAAQTCKSLNFDSFSAIWFQKSPTLFKCNSMKTIPNSFLGTWLLALLPSFLQSAGTAIGEIPPYWMTRAARIAAIEAGEKEEMPDELDTSSKYKFINKFKSCMISFLKTHGFWGVLLMASWPNFAFDVCGICCGHFQMPFWTFFTATLIGKSFIRNTYQSLIFVALFSENHMETFIKFAQNIVPDFLHLDAYIREALEEIKENSLKDYAAEDAAQVVVDTKVTSTTGKSALLYFWHSFMMIILIYFTLSCIQHFAQYYQSTLDKEKSDELRLRLPPKVKQHLTSPSTGHLRLPPPTPKQKKAMSVNKTPIKDILTSQTKSVKKSKSPTLNNNAQDLNNQMMFVTPTKLNFTNSLSPPPTARSCDSE